MLWLFILFTITFSFLYFLLDRYIFSEVRSMHELLSHIDKKEYDAIQKEYLESDNPLVQVKKEVADFALQKQLEINELMKLETFRREFLADVSHELKTPIFAAQGFIHTLIDGAIDDLDVRDRFLEKSANSLDNLHILVEDLLTISHMEIGEITMHMSSFDLMKLTIEIFEQLEETAKKRGIKLRLHKFSPRSCYVFADKFRLSQVMTNLLVNGIKYGKEKGLVEVAMTVEGDSVLVSVRDDGPGIEPPHLNRIFERFYRIDKSRSKLQGGTGLGLAIVKHILEAHESKIEVESKLKEGTLFFFRLKKGKVINVD